jgi:hypothetical protein
MDSMEKTLSAWIKYQNQRYNVYYYFKFFYRESTTLVGLGLLHDLPR